MGLRDKFIQHSVVDNDKVTSQDQTFMFWQK